MRISHDFPIYRHRHSPQELLPPRQSCLRERTTPPRVQGAGRLLSEPRCRHLVLLTTSVGIHSTKSVAYASIQLFYPHATPQTWPGVDSAAAIPCTGRALSPGAHSVWLMEVTLRVACAARIGVQTANAGPMTVHAQRRLKAVNRPIC